MPVHASDVAFTYALYKDSATASPSAPLIADIDSVTARDWATAGVWFRKRSPMQFFESVNPMLILPEHLLHGVKASDLRTSPLTRAPVGTGQFKFGSWKAGASITLFADTGNYRGRPKTDRVIWSIASDFNTAFTRLLGGESDVLEELAAPNVAQTRAVTTGHPAPPGATGPTDVTPTATCAARKALLGDGDSVSATATLAPSRSRTSRTSPAQPVSGPQRCSPVAVLLSSRGTVALGCLDVGLLDDLFDDLLLERFLLLALALAFLCNLDPGGLP